MVGAGDSRPPQRAQGRPLDALAQADAIVAADGAPPAERLDAELIAAEALLLAGRTSEAAARIAAVEGRIDPRTTPGAWGEFLRLRGQLHAREGRPNEAYHDIAQSASVFDLVGERYQAAVSQFALGRLAQDAGARSIAERHLVEAGDVFRALGSASDLAETERTLAGPVGPGSGIYLGSPADADDALVQRLVNAAVLPDLLARELAMAVREAVLADVAVVAVTPARRRPARGRLRRRRYRGGAARRRLGLRRRRLRRRAGGGPAARPRCRRAAPADGGEPRPWSDMALRRLRMMAAVAHQGFDLCASRERPGGTPADPLERPLEPLMPGFICASPSMQRVVDQVQRLQGNDLTVLITGESGTGKELIARAIHAGSLRSAADVPALQLHDHHARAGRQPAVRPSPRRLHGRGQPTSRASSARPPAARCSSTKSATCRSTCSPSCCASSSRARSCRLATRGRSRVDVRVLAATNADLEQRVAEGKFREDLYYRLSVIRIHIPPLRQRRDEIPHLAHVLPARVGRSARQA